MSVAYAWSPDSKHFLTAILFPRLRVDNGYRLWSCNGALLQEERLDELTVAAWRPSPAALYPAPDESAFVKKGGGNAAATKTTATAAKYVPRHMREASGAAASAGGKRGSSLADLAAAQEVGGTAAAFRPGQTHVPLGAEAEATSASAARNKAKREAKKAAGARALAEAAGATAGVAALAVGGGGAPAAGGGGGGGEDSADKLEKKVRNVEKKLRQIVELKELVAGGKSLEANQLAKIKGEEGVKEELAALQAALQEAQQAGAGLAKNSQDEGKWR